MENDKDILYFLPEWDDRVQAKYDFWKDERDNNSDKVFSHQIYDQPNCDGILISKMLLEKISRKKEDIIERGVHGHMDFDGPIFGDCGAYSYKDQKEPPYSNHEIAEYYEQLEFDIGVSVDHLIIPSKSEERKYRQQLTLQNAKEFLKIHEDQGYSFTPVGSAQGWNNHSYYDSVEKLIEFGYKYIALGGLAGRKTNIVMDVLNAIQPLREDNDIKFHLFGVARLKAIRDFISLGVKSFDSASPLRHAWTGKKENYKNPENYRGYTAIRLPFVSRVRQRHYKNLVNTGLITKELLENWEFALYDMLRDYEFHGKYSPEEIAHEFQTFHQIIDGKSDPKLLNRYIRTLNDRPWEKCECKICKEIGIEVVIFRGNARNRRRGFHNTYVFYNLLQKILDNPEFDIESQQEDSDQLKLDEFL